MELEPDGPPLLAAGKDDSERQQQPPADDHEDAVDHGLLPRATAGGDRHRPGRQVDGAGVGVADGV